jgi:hypothetical protein
MSEVKQRRELLKKTSLYYLEDMAEHLKATLEKENPKRKSTLKLLKEVEAEIHFKNKETRA